MNVRIIGLLVTAASCSAGLAGEPIRFVRPQTGEKAPLRINFAAEKIQSREAVTPASLQPASEGGQSMGGAGILVNPKARAAALARRSWTSENVEADANAKNAAAASREDWENQDALGRGTPRARSDGSLFSIEAGPGLQGSGSGQPAFPERNSRLNPDNRAALRSMGIDPFGTGNRAGAGAAPERFGFGAAGFPGTQPAPSADPRRESGNGLAPRADASAPLGRDAGLGGAPLNQQQPESRRPVFDPADRPLRSNFELPTRPR